MGSACSDKNSVDTMHPGNQSRSKQRHISIKEEIVKFKKSFIFNTDISVSSSFELDTSRNGNVIK